MTGDNSLITAKLLDKTSGYVTSFLTLEEYANRDKREKEFSSMLEQAVTCNALRLGETYILTSEAEERPCGIILVLDFRRMEVVDESATIIEDLG